jgi:hypothetical protein
MAITDKYRSENLGVAFAQNTILRFYEHHLQIAVGVQKTFAGILARASHDPDSQL